MRKLNTIANLNVPPKEKRNKRIQENMSEYIGDMDQIYLN